MTRPADSADMVWLDGLYNLIHHGQPYRPRGILTRDLPCRTFVVNMQYPAVVNPLRNISHKFYAAEAFWILNGEERVSEIAPWNSRIAQYSDDGHTFFGAYGPRIAQQFDYAANALSDDNETRQAVITTWRPSPPKSKDIPCTVAFVFRMHEGKHLDLHVTMRSSDIWLGLPYDMFNFSMLAFKMAARLNMQRMEACMPDDNIALVTPRTLYLTAASSHLYETNREEATHVVQKTTQLLADGSYTAACNKVPTMLMVNETALMDTLKLARDDVKHRFWL